MDAYGYTPQTYMPAQQGAGGYGAAMPANPLVEAAKFKLAQAHQAQQQATQYGQGSGAFPPYQQLYQPYSPLQQPPAMNYGQLTTGQIICTSVTSADEVRAARVDPFNTFIFPDFAAGKIYQKRITDNGSSEVLTFELSRPKEEAAMTAEETPKEQNAAVIVGLNEFMEDVRARLVNIEKSVKERGNYESVSNNSDGACVKKPDGGITGVSGKKSAGGKGVTDDAGEEPK